MDMAKVLPVNSSYNLKARYEVAENYKTLQEFKNTKLKKILSANCKLVGMVHTGPSKELMGLCIEYKIVWSQKL